MIEGLRLNQRLVRRRQQREAGAEAGSENADAFIALLVQPGNRAPRFEHRLAAHLQRARDVGADNVVGAMQFGRHPQVVIWQAEARAGHARHPEQLA